MTNCNKSINRVFTKKVLYDLISTGSNEVYDYVVQKYLVDVDKKTNDQLISEIYSHLSTSYRNEYYYINTLLNKLLVNIHSVTTTTALSQIRIAEHIADFVMINGDGKVYEIKSDLDNFERLNDQLYDYYKAFSYVSVLSSESELEHVKRVLKKLGDMGDYVGIYVLTEDDTIFSKKGRAPIRYDLNLDYKSIFNLLRKNEYTNLLKEHFGYSPNVAPAFYYKKCFDLFCTLDIKLAQKLTFKELKKRNQVSKKTLEMIPLELKSVMYFSNFSNKIQEMESFLKEKYKRR